MLRYISKFPLIQATSGSAGYDIRIPFEHILKSKTRENIKTDLKVEIPRGYVGLIRSRSGLAFKHGIEVFHGTIDSDYYGYISIIIKNESDKDYKIDIGNKIAQLVIVPCILRAAVYQNEEYFKEITEYEDKKNNGRGVSGFGSTDT